MINCEECGLEIPSGVFNLIEHNRIHHPTVLDIHRPMTMKDFDKLIKDLEKIPARKAQMLLNQGFLEVLDDKSFVGFLESYGEHYEFMMGMSTYKYLTERYERLTGKKR